jgi:hypothetical protein
MSPSTSTPQDAFKRPPTPKPPDLEVGDTVRMGKGLLWIIEGFGVMDGVRCADLRSPGGHFHARTTLESLTVVSKGR